LPSLNLYNTSKKEIDKTVPNLFDNSITDAADVTEVNRVFMINDHNIPGKIKRCRSYVKDFNTNELQRMSTYAHNVLESICKRILPMDFEQLHKYVITGEENEWIVISARWTKVAQELPNWPTVSREKCTFGDALSRTSAKSITNNYQIHVRSPQKKCKYSSKW